MATFDASDHNGSSFILIQNLGNTCFMGASLQLICSIGKIIVNLKDIPIEGYVLPEISKDDSSAIAQQKKYNILAYQFIRGLKEVYNVKYKNDKIKSQYITAKWVPRNFYKWLVSSQADFVMFEQQDVSILFDTIFNCFERSDLIKDLWKSTIEPIISLSHYTTVTCPCGYLSKSEYKIQSHNIALPDTEEKTISFQDLLDGYNSSEHLGDAKCEKCGNLGLTKSISIGNTGKNIIIHINRTRKNGLKNLLRIDFVKKYVIIDNKKYLPKVIVNHISKLNDSGHYTATVYPTFYIDDDKFTNYSSFDEVYSGTHATVFLLEEFKKGG